MTLDASLRPVARKLIAKLGKDATITRTAQGAFDPVTGTHGAPTETPYSVKVTPPKQFRKELVDGNAIQRQDFQVSLAAEQLTFTPNIETDTITIDSKVYSIVNADPVYSGELVVKYDLHCRL